MRRVDTRALAGGLDPSRHDDVATRPDRILIRDLMLMCRIGVHDYEHEAPQRVRVNVELRVVANPAPLADDVAHVISYEKIILRIKALAAAGHVELVETLAERIAHLCLADRRAIAVRVRVEKLDVEPDAAAVGVEIERLR